MGLIQGSASFTRFYLDGTLPPDYLEEFPGKISRYAFTPIDETSLDARSEGWVNIMDMIDSRFQAMDYLKEPYLCLSWRVDERKVPPKALKRYCREAEQLIKEREGLEFLPKNRRMEIRDRVRMQLLNRVIPSSNTFDMVWNLTTGVIFFGSTSDKVCDEFRSFFIKTFEANILPVFPRFLAERIAEKTEAGADRLETLRPSNFMEEAGA